MYSQVQFSQSSLSCIYLNEKCKDYLSFYIKNVLLHDIKCMKLSLLIC